MFNFIYDYINGPYSWQNERKSDNEEEGREGQREDRGRYDFSQLRGGLHEGQRKTVREGGGHFRKG